MIDEVIAVDDETALVTGARGGPARGPPGRDLGGSGIEAAVELGARPELAGKRVVVIVPDCGERYMSLPFFAPE